jgi:hypothetical protein
MTSPTCGPLPWEMITLYPSAAIEATLKAVSQTAFLWFATVMFMPGSRSELPPIAITTFSFELIKEPSILQRFV